MRPLIHRLTRLALALAAVTICAAPQSSPGADQIQLSHDNLQNWKLANGDLVQATIVGYSRHTRVITLELPSGKRVHVAPRDLAGAGKFNWITSEAFLLSLSGYKVPEKAALPLVQTFLAVSLAGFLGLFMAFWTAASILTGQRSIRRAILAFSKFFLFSLASLTAGILLAWGLGKFLDQTAVVAMAISVVYVLSLAVILAMTCRIIGHYYGISEWTGIQVLTVAMLLFAVGSVVIVLGMPRAMNQPGIDDWLTEQVLTPLELA